MIVCFATQAQLDDVCLPLGQRWDSGEPVRFGEHATGCYDKSTGTLYAIGERCGFIAHESCHMDGSAIAACETIDPREF